MEEHAGATRSCSEEKFNFARRIVLEIQFNWNIRLAHTSEDDLNSSAEARTQWYKGCCLRSVCPG